MQKRCDLLMDISVIITVIIIIVVVNIIIIVANINIMPLKSILRKLIRLSPFFSRFHASDTSRPSLCEYPVCAYSDCDFVSVNSQAIALKVA